VKRSGAVVAPWMSRRARVALLAGVCACLPLGASCKKATAVAASAGPDGRIYEIPALAEVAYDDGLQAGWDDEGWSLREVKGPGPARVRMADMGGWMLRKVSVSGEFGGLAFRYRAPAGFGDFLEVRLDSEQDTLFPRVQVDAHHVARRDGEWVQLFIPWDELNPNKRPFSRLIIRASKPVGGDWVELDKVGLTEPGTLRLVEGTHGTAESSLVTEKGPRTLVEYVDTAYEGGLRPDWEDKGWSERELAEEQPARLRLDNLGGWILHKGSGLKNEFEGLAFRYRAPRGFGTFLEVRLDSEKETLFPRIQLGDRHVLSREGEWTQVFLPMEELNPDKRPFTRVVIRAFKKVGPEWVEFDKVGFANLVTVAAVKVPRDANAVGGGRVAQGEPRPAHVVVDCTAPGHRISPLIYGIAFNNMGEQKDNHQWELGATARRWGGNPTTRYNWKLGNAWNTANDWFFRNIVLGTSPNYTSDNFLKTNQQRGMKSALTVPMIGWVAKDTSSVSFPAAHFGQQKRMDPDVPGAGNGLSNSGEALKPLSPTQTSTEAPPSFIGEWVRTIREKDKKRGRTVHQYILDNEPMLWNTTHRDVHPEPTSYDELLERTIAYGSAVREADPDAQIAGPALWGWTNYYNSAADVAPGGNKKDRKAHGGVPLLAWYLKKLNEYEKKTGVRVLDVVDVHFYPQGDGIGFEERGATDADTAERRIRSTRALWDATYTDESWIDDKVELIPRLKRWVAENYPGLGISIGEYNFGATGHMSGGLAQAEALGRFAEGGLTSAFHFTYPPYRSPTFWAFRAYRNFDGKGGRFQDHFVPSKLEKGSTGSTSLFASRSDDGKKLVAVAMNLDPEKAQDARVEFKGCGPVKSTRVLGYAGEPSGFSERQGFTQAGSNLHVVLPPYSITVLDLTVARE